MKRLLGALLLTAALTAPAWAHFVYVVPQADGSRVQVVFSDNLAPDDRVDVGKIAGTKLTVRDAAGRETPLTLTKGEHALTAPVPGKGTRVVFGTTVYGVSSRGTGKPFLLTYHPKAILGNAGEAPKLGESAALEIVPILADGKVRFRVLAQGKAVAESEVTVLVPGEKEQKATTDKEGLTPEYTATGRYGVTARHVETASGEHDGKKYEEARHYATLVVDAGAKR
jgi:hypothetical protein